MSVSTIEGTLYQYTYYARSGANNYRFVALETEGDKIIAKLDKLLPKGCESRKTKSLLEPVTFDSFFA